MSPSERAPSLTRYLIATGTINRWFPVVFVLFSAWLVYVRATGGRVTLAHYFFLFLLPLAAGTGLLTSARSGTFDLLIGAGETRPRIWRAAFLHAWMAPAAMAYLIFLLSGTNHLGAVLVRLPGVLLFTGGIAFAAGLIELRYVVGVLWLLARLLFVMMPPTLHAVSMLTRSEQLPSPGMLVAMVITAPETLLELHMPPAIVLAAAVLGIAALFLSYRWFRAADFGGKRA